MNGLLRRLTTGHASDNDLLAYYLSPLAGQPHPDSTRNASRRQVAILELDPPEHGADDGGCSLRSRRGLASGLAIVAPSDSSFILLSPPSTAPLSTPSSYCPAPPNHQRSTSESLPRRKFPLRDTGIVGTARLAKYDTNPDKSLPDMYASVNNNTSLHPPIFQQPTSSYQSSLEPATPAPVRALKIMKRAKAQDSLSPQKDPQLAPQTGEKKRAVVPPSTVDPESITGAAQPKSSSITSPPILVLPATDSSLSYAKYEPGVHSTAGPLPPPPRLPGFQSNSIATVSPPPPRPPRLNSPMPLRNTPQPKDIEAMKQALQLPSSVSATLASRTRTMSRDQKEPTTGSTVPSCVPHTVVARSTSSSTIPSSSLSSMSSPHPVHHHEDPSTSDAGSPSRERQPENDAKGKQSLVTISAMSVVPTIAGQSKNGEVQVRETTTEPLTPEPIPEESTASGPIKGADDVDPHHDQDRRKYGSVVTMGNDLDDSAECWVAISRTSSPQNHDDRLTPLDNETNKAPSPPPKSFRNSLTTGLKRLSSRSLPRTPSISSGGSRRSSIMSKRFSTGNTSLAPASISATVSFSGSANASANGNASASGSSTKTPQVASIPRRASTALGYVLPDAHKHVSVTGYSASADGHGVVKSTMRKRQKAVVQWPSAMFCNEIHATNRRKKLTSGEKCVIYAQKINELYMYDCGLTQWVVEMKCRGPSSNSGAGGLNKKFLDVRSPTSVSFTPHIRQTSRSSIISNATFPTRPDATTATDLLSSSYDDHDFYREDVPPLPYPSLATAQRAAASNTAPVASPSTSNTTLMTSPAPLRSSGSSSTLPSMSGGSTNTHLSASTLPPLTHSSTPSNSIITIPLSPTIKHPAVASLSSNSSTGGFFATLGRKASLSSAKRPTLGLGLSNLISSSLSPSSPSGGGLSSPLMSGRRLLTKSTSGLNGGVSTRLSTLASPNSFTVGGGGELQMNMASLRSAVPGGPRAPVNHNRVQRSKTLMPCSTSFHDAGASGSVSSGGGSSSVDEGMMMERRPSFWELQLNHSDSTSDGTIVTTPMSSGPTSGLSSTQPHHHRHLSSSQQLHPFATKTGYRTDSSSQLTHRHHHSQSFIPTTNIRYSQPLQQQQAVVDPQFEPNFICQVDKLAELLPHADRNILSGYLRRAGRDILAIGQYLEDEKNGTLKTY